MLSIIPAMPDTKAITLADGRAAAFIDYGPAHGAPVIWCHGGPGSRVEPALAAAAASEAGFRVIGIDRPGYGKSTPKPGRSIADWVPDALAVADAVDAPRFIAVGVSTGGAYSLALAARAPARVIGVVACCALTDMRWAEGKAMMKASMTAGIWNAPDRNAALALATDVMGADGSRMLTQASDGPPMPPADLALMRDPTFMNRMAGAMSEMFAFSVQGYVDDRIADGAGWGSFDISNVRCPVTVLHGEADSVVPVAHARHTASILGGATLQIVPELGHFSIIGHVLSALQALPR
jgi:pimeloyl-ACP methyl ester carboxylesterase